MKNVTLDRTTVLQLDADGTDGALNAAADCHVLCNDTSVDLCAIADRLLQRLAPSQRYSGRAHRRSARQIYSASSAYTPGSGPPPYSVPRAAPWLQWERPAQLAQRHSNVECSSTAVCKQAAPALVGAAGFVIVAAVVGAQEFWQSEEAPKIDAPLDRPQGGGGAMEAAEGHGSRRIQ
jgi:hypothetical protein